MSAFRTSLPFAESRIALDESSGCVREKLPSLVATEAMYGEAGLLFVLMEADALVFENDAN